MLQLLPTCLNKNKFSSVVYIQNFKSYDQNVRFVYLLKHYFSLNKRHFKLYNLDNLILVFTFIPKKFPVISQLLIESIENCTTVQF